MKHRTEVLLVLAALVLHRHRLAVAFVVAGVVAYGAGKVVSHAAAAFALATVVTALLDRRALQVLAVVVPVAGIALGKTERVCS